MLVFCHCEIDDAIIHYRGVIFLFSVLFSHFKLLCRISRVHLARWSEAMPQKAGDLHRVLAVAPQYKLWLDGIKVHGRVVWIGEGELPSCDGAPAFVLLSTVHSSARPA